MSDGYLGNHFLVSMPSLDDQNFHQTVSLICLHSADGALGIVLNRLSGFTLKDIFNQLEILTASDQDNFNPVLEGGPVHQEYGMVLHNQSDGQRQWQSTLQISDQLALTSSKDILIDIAQGRGPERAIMSLGYAGWGPGQLEQEIVDNAWFSTPVDYDILFSSEVDQKWVQAANLIGMDYGKLSNQVGQA